jgi:hypothetical protein
MRGDASQTLLMARKSANARNNHLMLSKLLEVGSRFGHRGKHSDARASLSRYGDRRHVQARLILSLCEVFIDVVTRYASAAWVCLQKRQPVEQRM